MLQAHSHWLGSIYDGYDNSLDGLTRLARIVACINPGPPRTARSRCNSVAPYQPSAGGLSRFLSSFAAPLRLGVAGGMSISGSSSSRTPPFPGGITYPPSTALCGS